MSDTELVRHVRVQIRANWTYFRSPYIFYVFRNSLRSILHSRKIYRIQEPSRNDTEYIRHFELIENELNFLSDSETRIRTDNKEIKGWIDREIIDFWTFLLHMQKSFLLVKLRSCVNSMLFSISDLIYIHEWNKLPSITKNKLHRYHCEFIYHLWFFI